MVFLKRLKIKIRNTLDVRHLLYQKTLTFLKIFLLHNFKSFQLTTLSHLPCNTYSQYNCKFATIHDRVSQSITSVKNYIRIQ